MELAVMHGAVAKVEIDQALIRYTHSSAMDLK
jgi:hypothetical protein